MPVASLTKKLKAAITLTETLKDAITLSQAVDFVPRRPNVATIWRWATKGVRGVKLQTWLSGGIRVTTPDALEAFLRALNSDSPSLDEFADADLERRGREFDAALEKLGA